MAKKPKPSLADHFTHGERDLLILLCEKRDEVAATIFTEASDSRDRGRLADTLEQLLNLIKIEVNP